MRVKRYVVDSMPSALQQIRKDLGNDAVILNTKEVRTGGFLGLFSKRQIEVIAGIDAGSPRINRSAQERNSSPLLTQLKEISAAKAYGNAVHEAEEKAGEAGLHRSMQGETSSLVERSSSEPNGVKPTAQDPLYAEIQQMKELMLRISKQTVPEAVVPEAFRIWEERLRIQEVKPELVDELINKAMSQAADEELDEAKAKEILKHELRHFMQADRIRGIQPETKVVHLVGPTGVGKTTTIAKLAAEQVLKHRRKVGFITSDTYRIAAIEQLKTYANILDIPLEVVFSSNELPRAFSQLQDRDLIFMDTAGRNYRNEMYVSELNSLLQSTGQAETYLVLSLTTRYSDMKAIVDNFSRFKLDKLLLTKSDETRTYGTVLNMMHDFPHMISYITNGQNVPEDIELLDTEAWIERLLEGDIDE